MIREQFNNQKPLFFLFTCVKNGRPFISRLFDSLVRQTKKNFVHFIYDDGSTEPLDEMVNEYKQNISKLDRQYDVIYEKNEHNIGLNMATKHCIDMCSCPYFIWIDCDNFVDNHFFEELEKGVIKHKNATVFRTTLIKHDEKNNCEYEMYVDKKLYNEKKQLKNFLYSNYSYSFFAVNLGKYKSANPMNHFENIRSYFNDTQVLFSCALSNCQFVYIKKAIGYYVSRSESESHVASNGSIEEQLSFFENTVKNIKSNIVSDFNDLKSVVLSYHKMISLVKRQFGESYKVFIDRKHFINVHRIPRKYRYGEHNAFYWNLLFLKKRVFGK